MIGIRNTDKCATNRTNQFVWIIIKINVLFSMFVESEKKNERGMLNNYLQSVLNGRFGAEMLRILHFLDSATWKLTRGPEYIVC